MTTTTTTAKKTAADYRAEECARWQVPGAIASANAMSARAYEVFTRDTGHSYGVFCCENGERAADLAIERSPKLRNRPLEAVCVWVSP